MYIPFNKRRHLKAFRRISLEFETTQKIFPIFKSMHPKNLGNFLMCILHHLAKRKRRKKKDCMEKQASLRRMSDTPPKKRKTLHNGSKTNLKSHLNSYIPINF